MCHAPFFILFYVVILPSHTYLAGKKINRSHTHTHTPTQKTPPTPTPTHTHTHDKNNTPTCQVTCAVTLRGLLGQFVAGDTAEFEAEMHEHAGRLRAAPFGEALIWTVGYIYEHKGLQVYI